MTSGLQGPDRRVALSVSAATDAGQWMEPFGS